MFTSVSVKAWLVALGLALAIVGGGLTAQAQGVPCNPAIQACS